MKRTQFDDKMLEGAGQEFVRNLVSSVPDDELSMAWRSSLNERLLVTAQQTQKKKQRVAWFLRPAMGLSLTGALAALLMIRTAPMTMPAVRSSGNLEAALVQDHQQNLVMSDVAGLGVNPMESRPTESIMSDDWAEVDFESL